MPTPPIPSRSALSEVEAAILGCLERLQQCEAHFEAIEKRLAEPLKRDTNLAADELHPLSQHPDSPGLSAEIDQLDQQLTNQQRIWQEWQNSLTSWDRSLEQPSGDTSPEPDQ